jgi:hypothetical protein
MHRPTSKPILFVLLCAAWFLLLGPAIAIPIPELFRFSYVIGAVPAALAGTIFAYFYKPTIHLHSRSSRAFLGGAVSAASMFFASSLFIAGFFWLKDPKDELFAFGVLTGTAMFLAAVASFSGYASISGAVCAALLPKRLLAFGCRDATPPQR